MEMFRTSKMEETVILLDKKFDRVMVRAHVMLPNPIRIRVKMLEEIEPFYLRNAPEFDSQATAWLEDNGTLINYRKYRWLPPEPELPHDAMLICEAPRSPWVLNDMQRDTKSVCVVYRPPTWRPHEEFVYLKNPPATESKRFMQAISTAKPTKEYASIAQVLGLPTAGTHAITDDDLSKLLTVPASEMNNMRKKSLNVLTPYSMVYPIIPRIEPEDKTLLDMYQFILTLPAYGKYRLVKDTVLSKKHRFWKNTIRTLHRIGSIEKKPAIGFYFTKGLQPNYDKIQMDHLTAKAKMMRLIEQVDALKEFR